jgi:GNAT superfamily N-acetyltransferase
MIEIREAREDDVIGIRDIFLASYSADYPYASFYDERELKRLIFGDETLMLVATEKGSSKILGTASVVLERGAYTDLIGEFGRLAVHPDGRQQGIAGKLLRARIDGVRERLHVGIMEARVVHTFSVCNGLTHGFVPVGYLPLKHRFGDRRESLAFMVRYFGDALRLRRNHPRIIPEACRLAGAALQLTGLEDDAMVDDSTAPYGRQHELPLEELTTEGYASLLRLERGRLRKREIFGPLRLHYGFFKLQLADSSYLIARQGDQILGAVGFTHDALENCVRIFELISVDDGIVRCMLEGVVSWCREHESVAYVEVDVSAYAPRMQRTLCELGFQPAAFVPALAFHRVERLDVLKMVLLLVPLQREAVELGEPTDRIAGLVLESYESNEAMSRMRSTVESTQLLEGLEEEQVLRLAVLCRHVRLEAGEHLFEPGDDSEAIYFLVEGRVAIELPEMNEPLAVLGPGESLGEVAALLQTAHSARALALDDLEVGVLPRGALEQLARRRPDIGIVLYRNLAHGLGTKLRRADAQVVIPPAESE